MWNTQDHMGHFVLLGLAWLGNYVDIDIDIDIDQKVDKSDPRTCSQRV